MPDGRTILDRTTLSLLAGGKVPQAIEQFADGSKAWRVAVDATIAKWK
jgi:hypothetical protein